MDSSIRKVRDNVARLERELKSEKALLEGLEKNCPHSWGQVVWCGECFDGYQDPGDPEGTMGVDRQLPCWIPPRTIDKWKRVCATCGKVETTTQLKKEVVTHDIPVF